MPPPPPAAYSALVIRVAAVLIATVVVLTTFIPALVGHPITRTTEEDVYMTATVRNKQQQTKSKKRLPSHPPTIHQHPPPPPPIISPTPATVPAWRPTPGLCVGWCPPKIDVPERIVKGFGDCNVKSTLERLRSALQLENCAAATQSTANAQQVGLKIEKLADTNVFVFFRGAAALFNVDLMCSDASFVDKKKSMPRVISNGDAHPENFGSQVMVNGGLIWGVNDFDQSFRTPFSWDLKRGSTGTYVACIAYGWNEAVCRASIDAFISSYLSVVMANASVVASTMTNEDRFLEGSRLTMQSPLINDVFKRAREAESDEEILHWLRQGFSVDTDHDKFLPSPVIIPLPDDVVPDFQRAVDRYLFNGVPAVVLYPYGDFWKVLAVARRIWAGTGSIGLDRFYLLLRGRKSTYGGRIILEMKQEVHSLLEIFFRYHYSGSEQGKRAVDAERSAYPYANPFYGWTTMNGLAYVIREKSKHEKSVKLETLSPEQFLDYAVYMGKALAHYHFRIQCADHVCGLDDAVAADVEGWRAVRNYVERIAGGRDEFHMVNSDFALKEAQRQIEAWEMLRVCVSSVMFWYFDRLTQSNTETGESSSVTK